MERLTLEEIIALEPRLGMVLEEAREDGRRAGDKAQLYAAYKARLFPLVGWVSEHEELQETAQCETVTKALCEALDY